MSHLLELLGRGLNQELDDILRSYYWSSPSHSTEELAKGWANQPDLPEVGLELGLAHLREEALDKSIEVLESVCQRHPEFLPARLALASAWERKGDLESAITHLRAADDLESGQAPVLFALGFCLERLGQPDAAMLSYRQATEFDPSYFPARERLAAVALLQENVREAIEQYLAMRRDEPQEGRIRTALAHLYYRAGMHDQAVEEFESAIVIEPENWALVDDQVEALVSEGKVTQAIDRLKSLIEEQGPFADLHVRLADLYDQVGEDELATQHYLQALEIQPNYLEATVKLGTHHLIFGRWEEAAETFYQAADLNDRVLVNYVGMGVAQYAAGKVDDAMNSFDLAAAVEPNSTLLMTEMARLQLKAVLADTFSRSFGAIVDGPAPEIDLDNESLVDRQVERHAEQIKRTPGHADMRYRYGVLLRSQGKLRQARREFQEAAKLAPTYVQAMVKLGITLQEMGKVEAGIEAFRRALDVKQQHIEMHYKLGLLFTDREKFEESIRQMEHASAGSKDEGQIRAGLALSLQIMGLMDSAAATWRSLHRIHTAET